MILLPFNIVPVEVDLLHGGIGALLGILGLKLVERQFKWGAKRLDDATKMREELWSEVRSLREEMNRMDAELTEWKERYFNLQSEYTELKVRYEVVQEELNSLRTLFHQSRNE